MPNDLQYNAPTDANGNPFVGGVDPATGHLHPLEGGTTTAITGSPTSATAIRLVTETKDGGDAALGATTDAAVTSNATGTISAKMRGLVAILADVWDSVNHRVRVDGSGVTQPVSGTVTANAGTNMSTAALALETGGNLATAATNTTGLNNTVGTAAAAIPSKLVQVGGSDGTNARAIKTNTSGQLDVRPLTSSDQITTVPSGTQTVSGSVTANIGTSGSLALESGGHLATVDTSTAAVSTTTGATSDAAVTSDTSGTLSGKLRGLVKIMADMWDSANHRLNTYVANANTNGQATMANSSPVVIASDQSSITVTQGSAAAAGTAWRVQPDFAESTTNASQITAGNTDLFSSTDVSRYRHFSLQIVGTFNSCIFTVQASNDNVNFVTVLVQNPSVSVANITTISSAGVYEAACSFRYLRVRCTTFGSAPSGMTAELELYTLANPVKALSAAQAGTWTVQPGNTQNTTPWLVQGPTSNSTAAANAGTGKAIKASAGTLWSVMVSATGTAATTIYDNASASSGTSLLTIPANAAVGTIYNFANGAPAANGIFADQVANAPSITVYYR